MAWFECTVGGSGKGNTVVVTCAEEFAGETITLSKTGKTYTKTCPSSSPYTVTYYGVENGTYTVSCTLDGQTYSETVVVQDISCVLNYGFSWQTWVDTASQLDSSDYDTLDEVLADEKALRELFLEHACVDYMASAAASNEDLEIVINDDYCAKWINNSDYALDFLGANTVIKALMDEADKYGYGEWGIFKPLIPPMTSATAPSGSCFSYPGDASNSEKWKAFDRNESTRWASSGETAGSAYYVGYDFGEVKTVYGYRVLLYTNVASSNTVTAKIQYSSDNSTWTDAVTVSSTFNGSTAINCPKSGKFDAPITARYFRIIRTAGPDRFCITEFQLYEWGPKGNVPVMASNTIPYGTAGGNGMGNYSDRAYGGFDNVETPNITFAGNQTNARVWYKATNPICVKRFIIHDRSGASYKIASWKLVGSNDGTNWTVIESYGDEDIQTRRIHNVNNDTYYLYHGIECNTGSGGAYITELQFYGRELKVSVPIMTSDTAPYGVARCTDEEYTTTPAYKAFNGNDSDYMADSATNILPLYLYYKFTTQTVVKMARLKSQRMLTGAIVALNGDAINWTELKSITGSSSTTDVIYDIDNLAPYDTYGIKVDTTSASSGSSAILCYALQFYGLDYSEKEFESGTTKKWLYDHGVELVEPEMRIGSGVRNSYSKEDSQVYLLDGTANSNNATYAKIAWNIDLTLYSLIRCAIGDRMNIPGAGGGSIAVGASGYFPVNGSQNNSLRTAYSNFLNGQADLPDAHGALDVSNISSDYIFFGPEYAASNYMTLTELWLE